MTLFRQGDHYYGGDCKEVPKGFDPIKGCDYFSVMKRVVAGKFAFYEIGDNQVPKLAELADIVFKKPG